MSLNIIQKQIEKRGEIPEFIYHTQRELDGGKGKVRILVLKEDEVMRVEYICQYCQHHGYLEQEWKRPISFKCEDCGKTTRVAKLKDQVKREQKKAAQAEAEED